MATRAERKVKQRAEQERLQRYQREHPVLSGVVKVTEYQQPYFNYER